MRPVAPQLRSLASMEPVCHCSTNRVLLISLDCSSKPPKWPVRHPIRLEPVRFACWRNTSADDREEMPWFGCQAFPDSRLDRFFAPNSRRSGAIARDLAGFGVRTR